MFYENMNHIFHKITEKIKCTLDVFKESFIIKIVVQRPRVL